MFKKTQYFEAMSIQNNRQYNNERNLLKAGYSYNYIPTSVLLQIVKECVNAHNDEVKNGNKLKFTFIGSLDKEHAQFSLTGHRNDIDKFITDLCTTDDVLNHWTVSKISKYSLVH